MTLIWGAARVGSVLLLAFFLANGPIQGNQRPVYADTSDLRGLGSRIVCKVFTDLDAIGSPLPHFGKNCPEIPPPATTQCTDGIDNDRDGLIDYPADRGCSSVDDNDESGGASPAACSDGIDNDSDGFIDTNDPNCHTDGNPTNASSYDPNRGESGFLPACWNGLDDDGDGKTDFPADPGCTSATDGDETNPPPGARQCSDGIDNDADGLIDRADSGCHTDFNAGNPSSYDPNGNNEAAAPLPQCSDGIDNDADALIDAADPGCHTDFNASNSSSYAPSGNNEAAAPAPQCSDGIDNDGDGKIDNADPGCSNSSDNDETNPLTPAQCSDGVDNDSDGLIDTNDPNCHTDGNASNPASYGPGRSESEPLPACADGIDNDSDGKIDSADPGCSSTSDNDETNPADQGGGSPPSGGSSPVTPTTSSGGNGPIVGSFGVVNSAVGAVGGVVLGSSTTTAPQESCSRYLTAYIRSDRQNDETQVRRLQFILRDFEGAKIEINGVYDAKTLAAVNAFQSKYAREVLTPWEITKPTGYVYLTTQKKLNEVYCRGTKAFPLNAEQLKVIQQTIAAADDPTPASSLPARKSKTSTPAPIQKSQTTASPESSTNWTDVLAPEKNATSTSTAGQESDDGAWSRAWDFIRGFLPQ